MSETDRKRIAALIVAGGRGMRVGGDIPKQYRAIGGTAAIARAFDAFGDIAVHLVIGAGQRALLTKALHGRAPATVSQGGATRRESVVAGLDAIEASGGADIVLIHDAARPFLPATVIERLVAMLDEVTGAVPVLPVVDTLVRVDRTTLGETVARDGLARVQTPQAFRFVDILAAHRRWSGPDEPTDDAQVARAAGFAVHAVPGDAMLEKITHDADLHVADRRFADAMIVRTAIGYDVHAFAGGDHVMLCGIAVPHSHALAGHSDADVGLHAITDALLGTIADGDIGSHFPPSDPRWKGADSGTFLRHAAGLVAAAGGRIDHIDLTIICEGPKVGPHRAAMRARIAALLALPVGRISVKATTTEQLGFTGRREGMAAQAIATVRLPE